MRNQKLKQRQIELEQKLAELKKCPDLKEFKKLKKQVNDHIEELNQETKNILEDLLE